MFKYIGDKLKVGKDTVFSQGIKLAINNQIKEYGHMLKFNLDSDNKTIDMDVMLDGEKEPLSITIEGYEIIQEDERCFVKIEGVKTSRAWINTIASSHLEGKSFEIPAEYAKLLQVVV